MNVFDTRQRQNIFKLIKVFEKILVDCEDASVSLFSCYFFLFDSERASLII